MFNTSIALNASSGITGATNAAVTFDVISLDKSGSIRSVAGLAPGLPHNLEISHQEAGKEGSKVDRHMVKVSKAFQATSTDPVTVCTAHVVFTVPRSGVTAANALDIIALLVDFVNDSANVTKLLNNEP